MDRSVVELYTLTYSDRTAAENDDTLFVRLVVFEKFEGFVFIVVSGIEIRGLRAELCRAGIDHLIGRVSLVLYLVLAETFDGLVEIAHLLCREIKLVGKRFTRESSFHLHEVEVFVQEPSVYLCLVVYLVDREASLERFVNGENPFVVAVVELFGKLRVRHSDELFAVQSIVRYLSASYRFQYRVFE